MGPTRYVFEFSWDFQFIGNRKQNPNFAMSIQVCVVKRLFLNEENPDFTISHSNPPSVTWYTTHPHSSQVGTLTNKIEVGLFSENPHIFQIRLTDSVRTCNISTTD